MIKKLREKIKFSNVMVVLVAILLILFTLRILDIVERGFMEPSALIAAVFAAGLGEFGILGWIKNTKVKNDYDQTKSKNDQGIG